MVLLQALQAPSQSVLVRASTELQCFRLPDISPHKLFRERQPIDIPPCSLSTPPDKPSLFCPTRQETPRQVRLQAVSMLMVWPAPITTRQRGTFLRTPSR